MRLLRFFLFDRPLSLQIDHRMTFIQAIQKWRKKCSSDKHDVKEIG